MACGTRSHLTASVCRDKHGAVILDMAEAKRKTSTAQKHRRNLDQEWDQLVDGGSSRGVDQTPAKTDASSNGSRSADALVSDGGATATSKRTRPVQASPVLSRAERAVLMRRAREAAQAADPKLREWQQERESSIAYLKAQLDTS